MPKRENLPPPKPEETKKVALLDTGDKESNELKNLERQRDKAADSISSINKNAETTVKDLDEKATSLAKTIKDTGSAIIDYHSSTSRKISEFVNDAASTVRESVFTIVNSMKFYIWVVVGFLAASGIAVSYFLIKYDPSLEWGFVIIWLAVLLAVVLQLSYEVKTISGSPTTLANQLQVINNEMAEKVASLPQPNPDVSILQDAAKTIGNALSDVASATLDLLPYSDKILEHRSKKIRQNQFTSQYNFALHRYGFQVFDSQIQVGFKRILWDFNDETLWLTEIIKETMRYYSELDPVIFRLIYFDALGEKKSIDPIWEVVSKTPELRLQLANLVVKNGLIEAPNVGTESAPAVGELLLKIPNYSLDAVKVECAEFFERLASFKEDCITSLGFFDLNIVEKRTELMSFMPKSSSHEKWRDEVLAYIAKDLLGINELYVMLLVRDVSGDAGRTTAWKSIFQANQFRDLASILAKHRIAKQFAEFSSVAYLGHLELAMQNSPDDFLLSKIEGDVRSIEERIIRVIKNVEKAAQMYRLHVDNLDFVENFVPSKMDTIEQQLLLLCAARAELNFEIFKLLYFTSIGQDESSRLFRKIIKDEILRKLLAEFLISSGFIPRSTFNENLVPLLEIREALDLTNFVLAYVRYERITSLSEQLWNFMIEKRVSNRNAALNFKEILIIVPPDPDGNISAPLEGQMTKVASELAVSKVGPHQIDTQIREELAMAVAALFLAGIGDPSYKSLCQKLPYRKFGSRLLYRYINLADQAILASDDPKLDAAAMEAFETKSEEPHFDYFKSQLEDGKLPLRASSLLSRLITDNKLELQKAMEGGFEAKILENYVQPMRDVLYQEIDENIVRDFLTTQVLTAYILTVPKNFPVIKLIVAEENFPQKAAQEFATKNKDSSYLNLVKLSSGGGSWTRVGLVPFGMSFETFAIKFEEVFARAIKLYNVAYPSNQLPYPLPFYIMRIFPTEDALKEIMQSEEVETRPLEIIRTLIRSSISSNEVLPLLTLMQPVAHSKIALRNVIETVIDGANSSLQTLFGDLISDFIGTNPAVAKRFEARIVDQALLSAYSVASLSTLAKKIIEQSKTSGNDVACETFSAKLLATIPELSQVNATKRSVLMNSLFNRLRSMGVVFTM